MAEFDPNLNAENLRKVNEEAEILGRTLLGVDKQLRDAAKAASKLTGDTAEGYTASSSSAKSLAKDLQNLTKDQLKGLDKNAKFKKQLIKLNAEQAARQAQIKNLQTELNTLIEIGGVEAEKEADALVEVLAALQEQEDTARAVGEEFEKIAKTTDKMEKANPFKGLSDVTKDIPVVGKIFSGMAGAADTFNAKLADANNESEALAAATKEIGKDLAKAGSAAFIGALVKGLGRADERAVNLSRGLGMSREEGAKLNNQLVNTAAGIQGVTAANLAESLIQVNQTLGTTSKLSADTLTTFNTLTKRLGVSADEASKLTQFSIATGQSTKEFTEETIGAVKVLNAQNDTAIDYKAILKDVSNVSNAVKLSTRAQGQNLAEAAFQAKKMGLSMGELDNIAGGLLDFEQSIANELEAELLLGQDLNLEKARQFAMDEDLVGLSKELQKQNITAAKFEKMSRIEKETAAKALGMTRESMADMFVKSEALANLNKIEGVNADNMNDAIKQRLADIEKIADADERKAALDELRNTEGAKELVQQQRNLTLQEKQEQVLDKILDAFGKLTPVLDTIHGIFNFIAENISHISNMSMKFGSIMTGSRLMGAIKTLKSGFTSIRDTIKSIIGGVKNVGGAVDDATKAVTGTASKAAGGAAKAGGGIMGGLKSMGKGLMGGISKVGSSIVSGVKSLNPAAAIKKFLKGGGLKSILKKIPGIGSLISTIIAGMEIKSAASGGNVGLGEQIDFAEVGKQTLQALGGLGGGILGSVLGSAIGPGIGTFLGGIAGDAAGRYLAGLAEDILPVEAIGKTAVDIFGGDEAADFISRPGQPIQKFREDDIIIGATNPFGGGGNGQAIQLLERLVNAVEQGAVINMDGNKVGTALGMASYRTQ